MTKLTLHLVLGFALSGLTMSSASASPMLSSRHALAPATATRTLAKDEKKEADKADKADKKDKKGAKKDKTAEPAGGGW